MNEKRQEVNISFKPFAGSCYNYLRLFQAFLKWWWGRGVLHGWGFCTRTYLHHSDDI